MKKRLKKLKIYFLNNFNCKKFLYASNFYNIKPYKILDWHPDTFYYKAFKNSKVFFIKISLDNIKIQREVKNNRLISKILDKKFLVEMKDYNISKKRSFIQFEFIDNFSNLTNQNFKKFHKEIFSIINEINKKGYIHRDIKPDNFLVGKNFVKIIDFEFITSLEYNKILELDLTKKKNLFRLINCGSDFKKSYLVWNDFHSFLEISKKFKQEHILNYLDIKKHLINSTYTILNEKIKL